MKRSKNKLLTRFGAFFMVLALVLPTLISAGPPLRANAAEAEVTTDSELTAKLTEGTTDITVAGNITIVSDLTIGAGVTLSIGPAGYITVANGTVTNEGTIINHNQFTIAGGNFVNNGRIENRFVMTSAAGNSTNNGIIETLSPNGLTAIAPIGGSDGASIIVGSDSMVHNGANFYDSSSANLPAPIREGSYLWDASLSGWKLAGEETGETGQTLAAYNDNGVTTQKTVDENGNSGFVFPTINGVMTRYEDIPLFNMEISTDGGNNYSDIGSQYTWSSSYTGGKQYGYWDYQIPDGPLLVGFWMQAVTETTKVRISLKTDSSDTVIYTITVPGGETPNPTTVTSFEPFKDPSDTFVGGKTTADGLTVYLIENEGVGEIGIKLPGLNGGAANGGTDPGKNFGGFDQDIKKEIKVSGTWVDVDDPASGLHWDSNWGWWDNEGLCGFWFKPLNKTTDIRFSSKANPSVQITLKLLHSSGEEEKTGTLSPYNDNGVTTAKNVPDGGNCGFVFPTINGMMARYADIELFNIELSTDDGVFYSDIASTYTWTEEYVGGKQYGWWDYQIPDGGPLLVGFWMQPVTETTKVRISLKTDSSDAVIYTMTVPGGGTTNPTTVTSFEPFLGDASSSQAGGSSSADGLTIYVNDDGGIGIKLPGLNGGTASGGTNPGTNFGEVFDNDIKKEIKVGDIWYEWGADGSNLIWNTNFGWWGDGGLCGFWFNPIFQSTEIRFTSKTNPDVSITYTLYVKAPRQSSHLHINEGMEDATVTGTVTVDNKGMVEIVAPFVGESKMTKHEAYHKYIRTISKDGGNTWESVTNGQENPTYKFAYSLYSKAKGNQAGIREDDANFLWYYWLAPVTDDLLFRISDPDNTDNYVTYTVNANPNAQLPEGASSLPTLENTGDWNMIWSDEFDTPALDTSKWSHVTGFFINEDPGTWGWGNNEYEWYTDSTENTYLKDGNLNFSIYNQPKTSFQVGNSTLTTENAKYSSGKIVTKGNFSFTYGRIDFKAKLPAGTGLWPAMWLLPENDEYGGWASSGEIDVLEARGRVPTDATGALHFGGGWPDNKNIGGEYTLPDNGRIDDGYHVYSLVWEREKMVWYADGIPYYYVDMDEWYSLAAPDSETAPFDQDFYIIMNLAAGGWFDGALDVDSDTLATINPDGTIVAPKNGGTTPTMLVDYVRVYQRPEGGNGNGGDDDNNGNGNNGNQTPDNNGSNNNGGNDNHNGSDTNNEQNVTPPANQPPITSSKPKQPKAVKSTKSNSDESTNEHPEEIIVELTKGQTLDRSILLEARKKNVNIRLYLDNQIVWTILGSSIQEDIDDSLNLVVTLSQDVVDSILAGNVAGENEYLAFSIAHKGEFGFDAILTMQVPEKYIGKTAGLYYFNESTKELELQMQVPVKPDGTVDFNFTHASEYIIVFADASEEKAEQPENETTAQPDTSARQDTGKDENTSVSGNSTDQNQKVGTWITLSTIIGVLLIAGIIAAILYYRHKEKHQA